MATEIKLPSLGKKVQAVEVLSVKVSPGDVVKKGDPLLEIESDKGTQDFPSPVAGKVVEVLVKNNDRIGSGHLVCRVEGAGESAQGNAQTNAQNNARPEPTRTAPAPEPKPAPRLQEPRPAPAPTPTTPAQPVAPHVEERRQTPDGHVVRAGPATRHLARKLGVDLHRVRGSGRAGRVTPEDVEQHVKRIMEAGPIPGGAAGGTTAIAVPELPDFTEWGPIERKPLSRVRQVTAEHMSLCWSLIPHVTQHDTADITELEAFRQQQNQLQKQGGVKLTVTAFVLKVCAAMLKAFPEFNSTLDLENQQLILKQHYHIGVAVDTPNGLLVPVIRDVDRKSVLELAGELDKVAKAARERKADMNGGTFTISNLGGIGGTGFTPIVNWPQVAILGLSRSQLQPVIRGGEVVPRLLMPLSLSYDHRVIDGAAAARFTRRLAEMLENPWNLVLHA